MGFPGDLCGDTTCLHIRKFGWWTRRGRCAAKARSQSSEVRGQRDEVDFFNGSFLVDPKGELAAKYYKRRLVMFREYMPLARLPVLNYLRKAKGGFTSGEGPVHFEIAQPKAKIAMLICFEDVFPHLVREYVDGETDFVLNL